MNLMTRSMWKYDSNLTLTDPCVSASCIKSLRKWYNILKPSSLSKIHLFLLRYGLYKSIVTKNPNVCNTLQWTRGSEICRKQWACVEIWLETMGTLSHHHWPRLQLSPSWLSHYFIWLSISPNKSLNIKFFITADVIHYDCFIKRVLSMFDLCKNYVARSQQIKAIIIVKKKLWKKYCIPISCYNYNYTKLSRCE